MVPPNTASTTVPLVIKLDVIATVAFHGEGCTINKNTSENAHCMLLFEKLGVRWRVVVIHL